MTVKVKMKISKTKNFNSFTIKLIKIKSILFKKYKLCKNNNPIKKIKKGKEKNQNL